MKYFSIYAADDDIEFRKTSTLPDPEEFFLNHYPRAVAIAEDHFGICLDEYGDDDTIEYEIADADVAPSELQAFVDKVLDYIVDTIIDLRDS